MNSLVFDIINNYYYEEYRKSDPYLDDFENFPDILDNSHNSLEIVHVRRNLKRLCVNCTSVFCSYIPYFNHKVMCLECSDSIIVKSVQMKKMMDYEKNIWEKKKRINRDIIEFGMNPIRIKQTCLFETLELFSSQ